jgi:hypothetical protein
MNKLLEIQRQVKSVKKSGYNSFQNYKYVQLEDILNALRPYLEGCTLTQTIKSGETRIVEREGCFYTECSCVVTTCLTDVETTECVFVESLGYALDKNSDKSTYKAQTGGRKYGLLMLFALDTGESEPEDDGTSHSTSSSRKTTSATVPATTKTTDHKKVSLF